MTEAINIYLAPGSEALPVIPQGPIHPLGNIAPFAMTVDIPVEDFVTDLAFLGTRHENPCLAVRWLNAGDSLGVIQFCELEHHMDVHAHRMSNPDRSTTTWRA